MHFTPHLAATLLAATVVANPVPGQNVPITDTEWTALTNTGLDKRSPNSPKVNQPISDAEWATLNSVGLNRRDLDRRDKTMTCGHLRDGSGGSNGHGKWIPVSVFGDLAHEFCEFARHFC